MTAMRAINKAESQNKGEAGSVMLEPSIVDNTTPNVVPKTPPVR